EGRADRHARAGAEAGAAIAAEVRAGSLELPDAVGPVQRDADRDRLLVALAQRRPQLSDRAGQADRGLVPDRSAPLGPGGFKAPAAGAVHVRAACGAPMGSR